MNIQEIVEALKDIGASHVVETRELEDGEWTHVRLTNVPPLTLSQVQAIFSLDAELVGLQDEGESLIQELEDLLLFSDGRLAVYPEAPAVPVILKTYAVRVTTWDTYKVLAASEEEAKEIGIDIEKDYNPVTSCSEINAEEWD